MVRRARRGKDTPPADEEKPFQHSSRHVDLESLLADHMLNHDAAATTADWLPSRRGNSAPGS
jgi:hypothetical protein